MQSKLGDDLEERGDGKAVKGANEVQVEVELLGTNGEDADDRPNGAIDPDAVGIPKEEDILEEKDTCRDPEDTGNDLDDTFRAAVPGISKTPAVHV